MLVSLASVYQPLMLLPLFRVNLANPSLEWGITKGGVETLRSIMRLLRDRCPSERLKTNLFQVD